MSGYAAGYPDDPDFDDDDDDDEEETEEFDFENYLRMAPYASPTLGGGTQGSTALPPAQAAYYALQQQQHIRLGQHWPLPPTPQSAASSSTATTTGAAAQHDAPDARHHSQAPRPTTAPPHPPDSPSRGGPRLALDTGAAAGPRPPSFYAKAASGTFYSPASSPAGSARSSAQMAAAPAAPGSPRKGPQLDLAAPHGRPQQQRPESPRLRHPAHPTHSRKGSDSVAYVREDIEAGAGGEGEGGGGAGGSGYRWVLERRRAGEDGSSELVRRDFVEGGMI